jgi:hypothetical protein
MPGLDTLRVHQTSASEAGVRRRGKKQAAELFSLGRMDMRLNASAFRAAMD